MKLFGTTAFAALVAGSAPALALDLGSGFTVSGDVELEYSADEIGNEGSTAFIDATLGWRSQAGGSIGFGFDLDLVGMESFGAGFSASAITGGLVLTTEFGELTVGNPRPLLSTMIDTPMIGGLRTYDVQLENLSGSTLEFLNLTTDEAISTVQVSKAAPVQLPMAFPIIPLKKSTAAGLSNLPRLTSWARP
jgi:hypothetical protein